MSTLTSLQALHWDRPQPPTSAIVAPVIVHHVYALPVCYITIAIACTIDASGVVLHAHDTLLDASAVLVL